MSIVEVEYSALVRNHYHSRVCIYLLQLSLVYTFLLLLSQSGRTMEPIAWHLSEQKVKTYENDHYTYKSHIVLIQYLPNTGTLSLFSHYTY